jgi:hypothetical protein
MIVELATVVSFKDSNHNVKCIAKKTPAIHKYNHSFLVSFINSLHFKYTIGNNSRQAKYILFILIMVAGASDHFTKIAAKDIAIIETVNSNPTGVFIFPPFFKLLKLY